ncbi:MAG: 16S rRNA (cytidine(1402)-2-O)-methyltransferase [Acetilactobacillus jinshanensis]
MLLNHYHIHTPEISLHQHNYATRVPELIQKLKSGVTMAQSSDAGMPSISDPGHELVVACVQHQIPVIPLPGPTAGMTGLIASGLSPQPFYFYGFLDRKRSEQLEELKRMNHRRETMIIYEAPHRLKKTLKNMVKVFGENRRAVLCRELTKRFEEFYRGTLAELYNWSASHRVRGEFVVLVAGNHSARRIESAARKLDDLTLDQQVNFFIKRGVKTNHAIKKVAKIHNLKRQDVYNHYHHIKKS